VNVAVALARLLLLIVARLLKKLRNGGVHAIRFSRRSNERRSSY
jgi:hypothetical protein